MSHQLPELHPEVRRLGQEITLLKEELASRLAELHHLEQNVKPSLLAAYQSSVGPLEFTLLQAQCTVARLRRKIHLVQASLNHGRAPDLVAVEATLQVEFMAWQRQLEAAAEAISAARTLLGSCLSVADSAELKRLYYDLVKKLHPDLHPGMEPSASQLWLQVAAAYAAGDLPRLQALALLGRNLEAAPPTSHSLDALHREHRRLRAAVAQLQAHLAELRTQPPFSMAARWQSAAWVEQRKAELVHEVRQLQEQSSALEDYLCKLLRPYGGTPFGSN